MTGAPATFDAIVTHLEQALSADLPGAAAHARFAPGPPLRRPAGTTFRRAAGLLLVFPVVRRPHVLLTVRAGHLGRHGGQVSLPGGVIEPGESVEAAALREAHEEVGLAPADVRLLGALTPIDIAVTGFTLYPVVGAMRARPALAPAPGEVARLLEVPVAELQDPARRSTVERTRDGRRLVVPALRAGGEEVWGATAMVLAEFLAVLGGSPPG